MANRVCLGFRTPANPGIFISQPGNNVLTASEAQMLLTSNNVAWQLIQSGQVALPLNGQVDISHPNLGYYPSVYVLPHVSSYSNVTGTYDLPAMLPYVQNVNMTTVRLRFPGVIVGYTYTGVSTYIIMRQPSG